MFIVIYTDYGDSCDCKARLLCKTDDVKSAIEEMKKDVTQYCEGTIFSITVEKDDEIWVGDEEEGCHWQVMVV